MALSVHLSSALPPLYELFIMKRHLAVQRAHRSGGDSRRRTARHRKNIKNPIIVISQSVQPRAGNWIANSGFTSVHLKRSPGPDTVIRPLSLNVTR